MLLTLPATLDTQLRNTANLTLYEYYVLGVLGEQPSHIMGLKSLASTTNASISRLSHVLTRLENAGLVRRRTSATDGRLTEAVLTDEGLRRVTAAAPGHVEAVRTLVFDTLEEGDVDRLADLLSRIAPDANHPVARISRAVHRQPPRSGHRD